MRSLSQPISSPSGFHSPSLKWNVWLMPDGVVARMDCLVSLVQLIPPSTCLRCKVLKYLLKRFAFWVVVRSAAEEGVVDEAAAAEDIAAVY
jgi:hypothetical protein